MDELLASSEDVYETARCLAGEPCICRRFVFILLPEKGDEVWDLFARDLLRRVEDLICRRRRDSWKPNELSCDPKGAVAFIG